MVSGRHDFVLLVFLFVLLATSSTAPGTLQHVNLLYRHGDRSPISIYPTDKNKIDMWPDGLGWLTNIGKEQQFELGQYLRGRYDGFINVTHFDHRQISIEASAFDRCLMSAASNLAGFFPPTEDQKWNKNINWQPIAIKSRPLKMDNKLALSKNCPRYDKLLATQSSSKRVADYMKSNENVFKMISKYTGLKGTLSNVLKVTDTLVCEEAHSLTWNSWAQENGAFENLTNAAEFLWDGLFSTTEMAKLKGGPLLKEMIENMKAASDGSSGGLKLHMYSAHDSTVSALLQAMTVNNGRLPPYRALVMVELHKIDGHDYVKIYLRNDTTKAPHYLVPGGCEDPCKLSTFQQVVSGRIPHDWDEECKNPSSAGLPNLSPVLKVPLLVVTIAFSALKSLG